MHIFFIKIKKIRIKLQKTFQEIKENDSNFHSILQILRIVNTHPIFF